MKMCLLNSSPDNEDIMPPSYDSIFLTGTTKVKVLKDMFAAWLRDDRFILKVIM